MAGGPPPGPPKSGPLTQGLANEKSPQMPDDLNNPIPDDWFDSPLPDDIHYAFDDPPVDQLPDDWLMPQPIDLPPVDDTITDAPNPDQPPFDIYIIYITTYDYPPESPEWGMPDWPWSDAPMLMDDFGYPLADFLLPPEFGDPGDWEPIWDLPLDPLDWLWPADISWIPWPDMTSFLPFPPPATFDFMWY